MPRYAVVTGASRGIGYAIAHGLAEAGCDVLLVARTQSAVDQAAGLISKQTGRQAHCVAADLATLEGVAAAAQRARDLFGHLDALVNNAGATARGSLFDVDEADWQDGFALKFYGAARLSRALWPMLVADAGARANSVGGAVLNIAGAAGRTPTADFVVGSAVNAAVLALTKSLADQGAADGVRVNAINPGLIATSRLQRRVALIAARDNVDEAVAEQTLAREWGVSRIGRPEEIASLAVYLTVGGGTYCQGGIFDVDGGRTRTL